MDVLRELERGPAAGILVRCLVDYMWMAPVFSLLYLLAVFGGRRWMQNRKPYVLRKQLVVWNTALALFSIVGFTRVMPLMIKKWSQAGIIGSVCNSLEDNKTLFWLALFTMSKVVEYGDTFFIVARKTPLMFLHWYHHITVSLYTWYNGGRLTDSVGLWFTAMNLLVHSVMYTYYVFKAAGVRVPKFVAQLVTMLQICQFTAGLLCILIAWYNYQNGYECYTSWEFISSGLVLYGSYLVLFLFFFYNRYMHKPVQSKVGSSKQE